MEPEVSRAVGLAQLPFFVSQRLMLGKSMLVNPETHREDPLISLLSPFVFECELECVACGAATSGEGVEEKDPTD